MPGGSKVPFSRRDFYKKSHELDASQLQSVCPTVDSGFLRHKTDELSGEPRYNDDPAETEPLEQANGDSPACHDISMDSNCNTTQDRDADKLAIEDSVDVGLTRKHRKIVILKSQNHSKKPNKQTRDISSKKAKAKLLPESNSKLAPIRPICAYDDVDHVCSTDSFTLWDVCIYVFSIGSYLVDVGTDLWVAYLYYKERHIAWFSLTLVFVLVPGITMTVFSLVWYIQDHQHNKNDKKSVSDVSRARWASRTICLLLQIGPVIRYIECLLYGVRSKKHRHWYVMLAFEDTDSTFLRLFECFMEAAPQLVLQLYIMMTIGLQDGWILVIGQIASCISSLASVSWALVAYHRSLRYSLQEKANITYGGMAMQFFWRFFTIGARVIALAMFASACRYWTFVAIGCHWIIMFIWILAQRTQFCYTRPQEFFFNVVIAVVYVFCYLNLLEGHTRLKYIFYYCLTYAENLALMMVWYSMVGTSSAWYIIPAMVAVFTGPIIGITIMVAYYRFLHPNNITQDFSDRRIKICVKWKDLSFCQLPQEGSNGTVSGVKSHNVQTLKIEQTNHNYV